MVVYPEKLIQMIWKCRLYARVDMSCIHGEVVQVIDPGTHNQDAGPDFQQARLRINEIVWVGHVEMHWQAQSWLAHRHHEDERYDNVILHVVWEGECDIKRKDGSTIPTLQLKNYVAATVLPLYHELIQAKTWIPCANQLDLVPLHTKTQVLDRMVKGRLDIKAKYVLDLLSRYANDWERVTRHLFAESFGMRVNKHAFSRLISSLPAHILDRYRHKGFAMESLLFGQAGFLQENLSDSYYIKLKQEYSYVQQLHQLLPMAQQEWRFLRMRPANFPTVRIAQLASIFTEVSRLCQLIISAQDIRVLQFYFAELTPSEYWLTHYRFGKITKSRKVYLSSSFLDHIAINCFVPLLYAYGYWRGTDNLQIRALAWLNQLQAERNSIVSNFARLGLPVHHAADSQALLHLHRDYCKPKQCLSCAVGVYLLGRSRL